MAKTQRKAQAELETRKKAFEKTMDSLKSDVTSRAYHKPGSLKPRK